MPSLDKEAGAIRIQRIPATERRGRVHSSTVTVAVLDDTTAGNLSAYERRGDDDFRVEWFNGTIKAGGQHHQKNATCCRMTHIPTGLIRTAQTRSRENSLKAARQSLVADLSRLASELGHKASNAVRRDQVGTGQRSDKRRTFRFQEDRAIDHETGRSARCSKVMGGRMDLLWS